MSWFSHTLSASFRGRSSDGEEAEEERPQQGGGPSPRIPGFSGKGVKDDFSELKKSIAAQLWGVASFLAPPPPPPPSHGGSEASQVDDAEYGHASNEGVLVGQEGRLIHAAYPGGAQGRSLRTDLEHQDPPNAGNDVQQNASVPSSNDASTAQVTASVPSSNDASTAQVTRFRGLRMDLAELKGTVSTGISRIMQAVKEEIDKQGVENLENEEEHESLPSPRASNLPRLNTILEPFFGNTFPAEKENDAEELLIAIPENEGDNAVEEQVAEAEEGARHTGFQEALAGISKLASDLFLSNDESDEEESDGLDKIHQATGITEEVLAFAREVSMHPETWIDFPLMQEEDEADDFEMSEAQQEHVTAVELSAPRLAALRIELCPAYMRTGRFWKIYFVLLHSRLSRRDAILLSTPQIMKARALLLRELQKEDMFERKKSVEDTGETETGMNTNLSEQSSSVYERNLPTSELERKAESYKIVSLEAATEVPSGYFKKNEGQKGVSVDVAQNANPANEIADEVQNKNVLPSTVKLASMICDDEDAEADEWLHEETSPHHSSTQVVLENDDDVNFSDLEEEDEKDCLKHAECSTSNAVPSLHLSKNLRSKEPGRSAVVALHKGDAESLDKGGSSSFLNINKSDEQGTKSTDRGEYSDWFTVDEDDITNG